MGRSFQTAFLLLLLLIPMVPGGSSEPELTAAPFPVFTGSSIRIEGDSALNSSNGVTSGSGTLSDPFVIENRTIYNGSSIGILIMNITKFVVIRNCTIFNMTKESVMIGIYLLNVRYVRIENCSISTVSVGILAMNSTDIQIQDLRIWDCITYGITGYSTVNLKIDRTHFMDILIGVRMHSVGAGSIRNNTFLSIRTTLDTQSTGPIVFNGNQLNECGVVEIGKGGTVENNTMVQGREGSGLEVDKNTRVVNNRIEGYGSNGIYFYGTVVIENNTIIENSQCGIHSHYYACRDTLIEDNNISGNGICGIYLDNGYSMVCRGNLICGNGLYGIFCVQDCEYPVLKENICSSNGLDGIHLTSSVSNAQVRKNTCEYNGRSGVYLNFTSSGIFIEDNDLCQNGVFGLYSVNSNPTISNNTITENEEGIYLGQGGTIGLNRIISNGIGLKIEGYCSGVYDNFLVGNDVGITVPSPSPINFYIWNNYFDNPVNCKDINSSMIRFNVEPSDQENIVGGPKKGGNYWSDYDGKDKNFDGFGDTPHYSGDLYPLMVIPDLTGLEDLTNGIPVTGGKMELKFRVTHENPEVLKDYRIDYRFTLYGTEDAMETTIGPSKFPVPFVPNTSVILDVPMDATYLTYDIKVRDNYGKAMELNGSARVIDEIPPMATEFKVSGLATGRVSTVRVRYWENVHLSSAYLLVRSDSGGGSPIGNYLPYKIEDTELIFNVDVPVDVKRLNFEVHLMDGSGLYSKDLSQWYPVTDVIAPEIVLLSDLSSITTYEEEVVQFRISDNIEIKFAEALIEISGESRVIRNDLDYEGDRIYSFRFKLPLFTYSATLTLKAQDKMLNEKTESWELTLFPDISDIILPFDLPSPETGRNYEIDIPLLEGAGIYSVKLSWSFDVGMDGSVRKNQSGFFIVPPEARMLYYQIEIFDDLDRSALKTFWEEVIDVIPPRMIFNASEPQNGMIWEVHLEVQENWDLLVQKIDLYADGSLLDMNKISDDLFQVLIPINAGWIVVEMHAVDTSNNTYDPDPILFEVVDTIKPVINSIEWYFWNAGQDQYMTITCQTEENRGIDRVNAEIITVSGDALNSPLVEVEKGLYRVNLSVGYGPGSISMVISVVDLSENYATWSISDISLPAVDQHPAGPSGERDRINWTIVTLIVLFVIMVFAAIMIYVNNKLKEHDYDWVVTYDEVEE